jgi:signal transduction histidine kinase
MLSNAQSIGPVRIDTRAETVPLNRHTWVFRDSTGSVKFSQLREEWFRPLGSEHYYFREAPNSHFLWMKVAVENPTDSVLTYVLYFHPGVDTVTVYHNGARETLSALAPLDQRPIRVAQELCTYVQLKPGTNIFFFQFTNRTRWSQELGSFIANLAEPDRFLNYFLWARTVQGICLGVVGIMIVFHFVIFLFFRDRTFLLFIVNISLTLIYLLILKHYHTEFGSSPRWIEWLRYVRNPVAALVCGTTLLFAQSFLATRIRDRVLHICMNLGIVLSAALAMLMLAGVELWVMEQTSIYLGVLTFLLVVIASLRSLAQGNALAWYTFLGFFIFMISVILFFFPLSYTDYRSNETDYHYYAEAFRAFIFAIGIADRFRRIRTEAARVELEKKQLLLEQEQKLQREKERISRDLHDNIGSQLTTLKLGLRNSGTATALESPLEEVITQLRNTIWAIEQPSITLQDLTTKLRNLVWQYQKSKQSVELEFVANAKEQMMLSPSDSVNALRIVQECLQNCVKHANASRIEVILQSDAEVISIIVRDDGVGFDSAAPTQADHFGLRNIQKRAADMYAKLQITSVVGSGTTIHLTFRALT